MKKTFLNAAKSTSAKLKEVWRKAKIPVKTEENICADIQRLYKEYQNLCKEKLRDIDKANMRQQIWKDDTTNFLIHNEKMV